MKPRVKPSAHARKTTLSLEEKHEEQLKFLLEINASQEDRIKALEAKIIFEEEEKKAKEFLESPEMKKAFKEMGVGPKTLHEKVSVWINRIVLSALAAGMVWAW